MRRSSKSWCPSSCGSPLPTPRRSRWMRWRATRCGWCQDSHRRRCPRRASTRRARSSRPSWERSTRRWAAANLPTALAAAAEHVADQLGSQRLEEGLESAAIHETTEPAGLLGGLGRVLRPRGRRLIGLRLSLFGLQFLVGRFAVDGRAVLLVQRAGLGRRADRVVADRCHQRTRGSQPGPRHRCRRAALGEHGDDRFTDTQRCQRRSQVVDIGFRIRADGSGQRLLIVGREGSQRVLDAGTELRQHLVGNVGGQLGAEEHPDAAGANKLHGLFHLVQESL